MNTWIIEFETSDLASRSLAAIKRGEANYALEKGGNVFFDFSNIATISYSYADELFGILAVELGANELVKRVKVTNSNDYCLQVVAKAILTRSETPPSIAA